MTRTVIWSLGARAELIKIARFIARENPAAASAVSAKLRLTASRLGEIATGRPGRVSSTYEKSVTGLPYVLAYEIVSQPEGGETVAILHVIHTAQDWPDETWPQPE